MKPFVAALLVVLTSGCTLPNAAGPSSTSADRGNIERIEYSISPCRGTCPAYKFTIAAEGAAVFEGERHTALTGRIPVQGGAEVFATVQQALERAKPAHANRSVSAENCRVYYTDQQVLTVEWVGAATQRLSFDLGCNDPSEAGVRQALAAARRQMPIDKLVGRATDF